MSLATTFAGPWGWLVENGVRIGLVLALASAIWLHGCHTGKMDSQKEIGGLETSLQVCGGTVKDLSAGIDKQNEASEARKAEGDRRVADSQAAAARAQGALDELRRTRAKADAYQRPAGVGECDAARSIVERDNAKK